MLLKKQALLATSSNALSSLTSGPRPNQPQCTPTPPRRKHRSRERRQHYSSQHNDRNTPHRDGDLYWPDLGHPKRHPTPYQIFNQKRGEPYSKRRFYELVKIYHPDRNTRSKTHDRSPESSSSSDFPAEGPSGVPYHVMLERYRLVIAANTILSDPVKRDAYDRFGHGWSRQIFEDPSQSNPRYDRYSTHHRWRTDNPAAYQWPPDQDPMFNATWEDWERWYRQQYAHHFESSNDSSSSSSSHNSSSWASDWASNFFYQNKRQKNVYVNNYAFVSLVFLFAALGGVGQATRVSEASKSRMERTQLVNEETSRQLMKARKDTLQRGEAGETKGKRIKRFLQERDDYAEGEFDGRALKEGDEGMCASGAVKDKDQPKFWEKPPAPEDR